MCGFYGPSLCIPSPNKPGQSWEKLPKRAQNSGRTTCKRAEMAQKNLCSSSPLLYGISRGSLEGLLLKRRAGNAGGRPTKQSRMQMWLRLRKLLSVVSRALDQAEHTRSKYGSACANRAEEASAVVLVRLGMGMRGPLRGLRDAFMALC